MERERERERREKKKEKEKKRERMAQPFEQVLESLRGIATGKLAQLEERSRDYLNELKSTIEKRVESERVKSKATRAKPSAAASKGRSSKRTATRKGKAALLEDSHGDKENAGDAMQVVEESESEKKTNEQAATGGARRSSRRATKSSTRKALVDANGVDGDAGEAAAAPASTTRTSRRLRSKKATKSGAAPQKQPASGGRVTRSRARQQDKQILETIVETTENEDSTPEQSPEQKLELVKEMENQKKTVSEDKAKVEKSEEIDAEDAPSLASDGQEVAEEEETKRERPVRKQKAKAQGRKKDEAAAAAATDDDKKACEKSVVADVKPSSESARRKSSRKRSSLKPSVAPKSPEVSKADQIGKETTDEQGTAETATKEEESLPVPAALVEKSTKPAETTQKKRGRARTKPRQRAQKQTQALVEDDADNQKSKKARTSGGEAKKPLNKEAQSLATDSSEEVQKTKRTRLSSRMSSEKKQEHDEGLSCAPIQESKDAHSQQVGKVENLDQASDRIDVPESKSDQPVAATDDGCPSNDITSTPTAKEGNDSKKQELSDRPKSKKQDESDKLTPKAEAQPGESKVKDIASKLEGKIKETNNVRISEVLEVEAAATKKAVEQAKSGGLKNMMSLLSPEADESQNDSGTLSRFEQATLSSETSKLEDKPSASLAKPGIVEKASNVITSVASFLPATKKDQPALKSRKPVEVKALKAAEAARKQAAAKLEEKIKRKEAMKDRAIAAREAKQRLEEQKKRQMIMDQQRKEEQMKKRGEEIARKKRERDEEVRKEREEKRRKMEMELQRRKVAEERAHKLMASSAPKNANVLAAKDAREQKHLHKSHKAAPLRSHNVLSANANGSASQPVRSNLLAVKVKPFAAGTNRLPNSNFGGAATKPEFKQPGQSVHYSMKENSNKVVNPLMNKTALNPFQAQKKPAHQLLQENKENKAMAFSFNSKLGGGMVHKTPELKLNHTMTQHTPVMNVNAQKLGVQSYQMTPYRSDSEESDDECRPAKPVPQWAKSKNLSKQLQAQMSADPDEIFKAHETSCSLDDVFKTAKPKPCYKRRGSSGDWNRDRVTWKEEWFYKKAMGYLLSSDTL